MTVADLLRGLPSLAGPLPAFDPSDVPANPDELFAAWLSEAISAGLIEPHALTLSTVDVEGRPSARVLILKDLVDGVWHFASSALSRKGKELANTPFAALTFYWPVLGRQVRVRGAVSVANGEDSARDFLARSPSARANALLGRQSDLLADRGELEQALAESIKQVEGDPSAVAPAWTLYHLAADEVEFWQGDTSRKHARVQYSRSGSGWTRAMLWP
ncbi:pyridoxal 5'-phosphate synthase [Lentzea sp. NPDC005914]|uniref:pyridoxine/pyridoxamine 5'-phosphate oxidase n=1 Tax=Lentzea sp. NPDC005914 TaxID=3154572 RepID=UPI0033F5245F